MSIARPNTAAAGQAPARSWVCREWRASHEAPRPSASRPGGGGGPSGNGADREVRANTTGSAHAGGSGPGDRTASAQHPGAGLALSGSGAHSPGAASDRAPRRASTSTPERLERRFSLLDRYVAGRELAAYIEGEFDRGRHLRDVVEDEFVSTRLRARPYLLADLMSDEELAERARRSDGTLDFDELDTVMGRNG